MLKSSYRFSRGFVLLSASLVACQVSPVNVEAREPTTCGDGRVDAGEVCDTAGGVGCAADCSRATSVCGDAVLSIGEICEDGNTSADDYCSADCMQVLGFCGDGVLQANERCDEGSESGSISCPSGCGVEGACGDGTRDPGEVCDDGNQRPGDYCGPTCNVLLGRCGDGSVDSNEACDDGNVAGGDYCSSTCLSVTGMCGDGAQQSGEVCDDGNYANDDLCAADCASVIGVCGDFVTQVGEQCDDGNTTPGDGCSADCQVSNDACGLLYNPATCFPVNNRWKTLSQAGGFAALRMDGRLFTAAGTEGLSDFAPVGGLGRGAGADRKLAQVQSIAPWKEIAVGTSHMCAIRSDDTLWCWGGNNKYQLGLGNNTGPQSCVLSSGVTIGCAHLPQRVSYSAGWSELSINRDFTCAKRNGAFYCFGEALRGMTKQLVQTPTSGSLPNAFYIPNNAQHFMLSRDEAFSTAALTTCPTGLHFDTLQRSSCESFGAAIGSGVKTSCTSGTHGCFIDQNDGLRCWGLNGFGQLGRGSMLTGPLPADAVSEPGPWASVSCALNATCAIKQDGSLWCFGMQYRDGYMNGTTQRSPVQREPGKQFIRVVVGGYSTLVCATELDGSASCFGWDPMNLDADAIESEEYALPIPLSEAL